MSMGIFLGAVVLNVSDTGRAAQFWGQALGYSADPDDPAFLAPSTGGGPRLHLDTNDRTHLDLWVDRTGSDLQTEVERFISLGAQRVEWEYPPDADFVVLADPDGNLFCVIA
jgi:catechol 2,3-dioxygenase-like lactoylglutathione lyase family enzyme